METIIKKYLEGSATEAEQYQLLEWLRARKNRLIFSTRKKEWKEKLDENYFPEEGEEVWGKMQVALLQKGYQSWKASRKFTIIFRYAAIVFFLIALGSIAINFLNGKNELPQSFSKVIADRGQVSRILLPDGSQVWLNSGSELSYSNHFAHHDREISLTGEAYFKVEKNASLPFIVITREINVKALGTSFIVSAYPDFKTSDVILEEGLVELRYGDLKNQSFMLQPGKIARYDKRSLKLKIDNVNVSRLSSWKEGTICVYDQPLSEVLKRLELRYNQKFVIEEGMKEYHYTFTIKDETLEDIIHLMERITPVKAVQKGDVIYVRFDNSKTNKTGR